MITYTDSNEEHFLEKLASKLGRPTPGKIPTRHISGPPDFWTKTQPSQDELLQQFIANAERLTVKCQLISNKNDIQSTIGGWISEIKAKSIICWDSPELKQASIPDICQNLGLNLTLWNHQADRREMIRQCANVDVGITWADYGVANTGSMAILSNPVQSRAVSLLPPVHIAILKRETILPHMGDIFTKLDYTDLPSSLTFITGPSRTSDIEMDLALGVHGPAKVFILILG
ncbi:MAG: hypothetical protein APF84_16735 [Gracilibacter sp. BRH_c7a]|nr:MAG: hypothetical protein APF84_16735 [Gracilibacter sp. BRH_c7a]